LGKNFFSEGNHFGPVLGNTMTDNSFGHLGRRASFPELFGRLGACLAATGQFLGA
jgi:hypothetical protein